MRSLATLVVLALLGGFAARAKSWIYWLRKGELGRLATDGSVNQEMDRAMAAAGVPIRAINGDLQPTAVETNREAADFDALVIEGAGHFPQLETPELFNLYLLRFVNELQVREALGSGGGG